MPGMILDLGIDKGQVGLLATILSLSYGMSKFFMGVLADKTNPRYMMSIGLILTGMCNIFFGLSSSLFFFAIFWGLNGFFQGCGWPPCARLLAHWYSQNERGSWWSSWNVSHNIGGALIPIIVAACSFYFGWRYALYIPGILCILTGIYLMNRLRDTPESLGLPPVEDYRNDFSGTTRRKGEKDEEISTKDILVKYVLKNKFIWLLAIANMFVYIVRTAINDWSALFLVEARDYNQLTANGCVSLFEIGGFCGSLVAGWGSDHLLNARRGPVNALFAFAMLLVTGFFWISPGNQPFLDSLFMFMIGFTVFGPQMLIGVAAAELSHKKAVSTATGFTGWFAYFGAALAGYPLGIITQSFGWDGFFWTIGICCFIAFLALVPLWSKNSLDHVEEDDEGEDVDLEPALD